MTRFISPKEPYMKKNQEVQPLTNKILKDEMKKKKLNYMKGFKIKIAIKRMSMKIKKINKLVSKNNSLIRSLC